MDARTDRLTVVPWVFLPRRNMAEFEEKRTAQRFPINPQSTCDFASPVLRTSDR